MNPRNFDDELAAAYVLGTLSAAGRRDVQARLPTDAALRAAVDDWEARLLPLTALAEPVEPSPALWTRIENAIAPAVARLAPTRTDKRHHPACNMHLWCGPLLMASVAWRLVSWACPSHTNPPSLAMLLRADPYP